MMQTLRCPVISKKKKHKSSPQKQPTSIITKKKNNSKIKTYRLNFVNVHQEPQL